MIKQLIYILSVPVLFVVFMLFYSCEKYEDGSRVYIVPAYKHPCSHLPERTWNDKSMDFKFTTNNTWIWEDQYPGGSHGWSKIRGFSEGFHKKNSLRLGYRYNSPYMIVGLYARVNGNIRGVYLDTIQLNQTYLCRLAREGDYYVVRMNGKEVKCKAGNGKRWGYELFPHVGGEYVIRHDWKVLIDEV